MAQRTETIEFARKTMQGLMEMIPANRYNIKAMETLDNAIMCLGVFADTLEGLDEQEEEQ